MPYATSHQQKGCKCDRCEYRRAYQRALRAGRRIRPSTHTPSKSPPVRSYGEPWDSIIQAGAYYSQPPSGLPRNSDKIVRKTA